MVLNSTDRVVAVRGAAGTGKTALLLEVIRGIAQKHKVVVVAQVRLPWTFFVKKGSLRQ